ncbi:MAG: undecaprenyldiphospho-muramoylpentapeptide beta-N-acetylglucosaminyltransferase [Spirochaetaceae bacterium]|jgi:UDP-N-acetylglucosamine--N-acetylmuramyl-(pentapeptide) pyrophosphoryl-undecaprenol N-acetylglucosamine transferase|nr:undecaprenyldiphospho-muramoylpentapeptide beta-N-acetylglucosaminyltransferase [Spirochaetaceae bacterium]
MTAIAFTGGGTGGHIYPALALIGVLREISDIDVFWIGHKSGMDRALVEGAGVRFYGIRAGKLRRYFSLRNVSDLFRTLWGVIGAWRVLARERPALLFSKGGFVSVPPVLAAALMKIPIHTHESDFSPGLATKINARFAACVWTAYEETARRFLRSLRGGIRYVGNPVRPAFFNAQPERGRAFLAAASGQAVEKGRAILMVLGGSQGAHEINNLVAACRDQLCRHFFVVHQTGAAASPAPAAMPGYFPIAYINDEMPDVLAAAALILGRSGAGTVWEAAAVGVPMVLVPLSGPGTRGDQVENAAYFTEKGAACTLLSPSADELYACIAELAGDAERRTAMAAAARQIGARNAARIIAQELARFAGGV